MSITAIILIAILVIGVIYFISVYNRFIALRNRRENAFADIDVQLRQRHDLIPQLVSSVKGYMKHEEGVLTKVTAARSKAISARSIDDKIEAEAELTRALAGLNVQVEAYPDLKANTNFMHLQQEISDVENKLAASRRYFNSATRELNTSLQKFPNVFVARMSGFQEQKMFDLGEDRASVDQAPKIDFS